MREISCKWYYAVSLTAREMYEDTIRKYQVYGGFAKNEKI